MTAEQPLPEPTGAGVPTCYRHPDRETYIRCARCNKPICPDCMVSAAVGFQCPDCIAEGRRTQRQPTTVFGGAVRARDSVVTISLIVVCVAAYGMQLLSDAFTLRFWEVGIQVADGQYYRLITSGFLHGGLWHIGLNMWALWIFGPPLERLLGRTRFLVLYLVSLLAGSTASYLFANPLEPSLGASGAIFGLVGAMIVVARRMHWSLAWVATFAVLNILLDFVVPNVDWHAHVGGLVGGAAVALAMVYAPRSQRVLVAVLGCVLVVGVCAGLVAWRSQQIRDGDVALVPSAHSALAPQPTTIPGGRDA